MKNSLVKMCHKLNSKPYNYHDYKYSRSWDKFKKTFTLVIYKCSYCFQPLKQWLTLVNYTCKSFIKLTPVYNCPVLSAHPPLSGQFSQSRILTHTKFVLASCIKRSPLLSSHGHLLAVPCFSVFVIFAYIKRVHLYSFVISLGWAYGLEAVLQHLTQLRLQSLIGLRPILLSNFDHKKIRR